MFEALRKKIFHNSFSKQTAKNRLQMVLVQDRSGLTTEEMELFRKDLLEVISKYFDLHKRDLDIEWQRSDSETALIINTPVVGRVRQAIRAAVAAS
jgi:cell division topological specificity factor